VRARGIEKRPIFYSDVDREDFLERVGRLADATAFDVCAWVLMPNHVHLLLRTGNQPLARSMSALLAGYATAFNLRHERAGHLFQNRYKSTLVEDEPYFLKLVQYIHLNPLPSLVRSVAELADYPYTGHSALMGRRRRPWQDVNSVLGRFSSDAARARALYERFIACGVDEDERPDLSGGGLVRSAGGWHRVKAIRRGREKFTSDERILGTSEFVEEVLSELGRAPARRPPPDEVIATVCRAVGIPKGSLTGNGRPRAISRARGGISYVWTTLLGCSGREIAVRMGMTPACVYKAARRARVEGRYWSSLLDDARRTSGKGE
jgi:REP element-mobilizing transposase RayT